jgi:hypothetical protein
MPELSQLAMIIHDNFPFHPPCSIGEEDLLNFSQSEAIIATGSHFGFSILTSRVDHDMVPKYYYYGPRLTQILHARLRMRSSFLNEHLYIKNITKRKL